MNDAEDLPEVLNRCVLIIIIGPEQLANDPMLDIFSAKF